MKLQTITTLLVSMAALTSASPLLRLTPGGQIYTGPGLAFEGSLLYSKEGIAGGQKEIEIRGPQVKPFRLRPNSFHHLTLGKRDEVDEVEVELEMSEEQQKAWGNYEDVLNAAKESYDDTIKELDMSEKESEGKFWYLLGLLEGMLEGGIAAENIAAEDDGLAIDNFAVEEAKEE